MEKETKPYKDSPFTKALMRLLAKRNITQDALANAIGVPRQIINYYVNGNRRPDIDGLITIAKYFGVSTDYLLGLTEIESPSIEDNAIFDILGLSEVVINTLKDEMLFVNHYREEIGLIAAKEKIENEMGISSATIINYLFDDSRSVNHEILSLLGMFFMYLKSGKKEYLLAKSTLDIAQNNTPPEIPILEDDDILPIFFVRLQKAIINYKKQYEKRNRQ